MSLCFAQIALGSFGNPENIKSLYREDKSIVTKKGDIMRLTVFAILLSVFYGSCACLPEPTVDPTPPTAGLIIEFYVNGVVESRTFSHQDPEITLDADEDRNISIIYMGSDNEGMKSLNIMVTVVRTFGGIQQREDWTVAPITASCPKDTLLGNMNFDRNEGERTIRLTVKSRNWMGLTAVTQPLKVKVR